MQIKAPSGREYKFSSAQISEASLLIPSELEGDEIYCHGADVWPKIKDEEVMAMCLAIAIYRGEFFPGME